MNLLIYFVSIFLVTHVNGVIDNCLECAKANNGNNYMCYSPWLFKEKWKIKCCTPGSTEANCKASMTLSCSEPFNKNPAKFYS